MGSATTGLLLGDKTGVRTLCKAQATESLRGPDSGSS